MKLCLFFCLLFGVVFLYSRNVWGYGENIEGFQTHYEIQNQYISGDNLVIEGFYYVYELQNFTDNTRGSGTHYYYMELYNGADRYTYNDTGGYYIDLTDIEYKSGYPWASGGESDVVSPKQSACNYRYRDIGFQFVIPISDLKKFNGESSVWNMNIACVATNTYRGRGAAYEFKQQNVYASKAFGELTYQDYHIKSNSELFQNSSDIYASVAYIRTAPGKSAGIATYSGNKLYWANGAVFYDLSRNTKVSTGCDTLTWYCLKYGNVFYDGKRYRASYAAGGPDGWIPSIFLGQVRGSPYTITIYNTPPAITASDLNFNEGTEITGEMLLEHATVYDYSFGTKKPEIYSTNLSLNSKDNKVGTYYVTYYSIDSNLAETKKTITVTIGNIKPEITAPDKELNYTEVLTKEFLMQDVHASDVGDGDITDKVVLYDSGGLILDTDTNKHGIYQVTYSVQDSNGETSCLTVQVQIIYRYVRAIDENTLDTLIDKSKWRNPKLQEEISGAFSKKGNEENYVQVWKFSNEDRIRIQEYMTTCTSSQDIYQWFLENYKRCRVKV